MKTPICDFVRRYAESDALRLHMPGHKGCVFLGCEGLDITEFDGADSLYEASGIIAESEANASRLFGCDTFYSTEGSSQCIRAMLYLAMLDAKNRGKTPKIAAGRNAHKTFLSAAALLDLDVVWIYPERGESYLACDVTEAYLEEILLREKPAAVYLTSPDYLGSVAEIGALAAACHRHGAMLLVDTAHGAYLTFLPESRHPMDLGADLCCDSAHKTLPVLTGGAYLHVADRVLAKQAKMALALFGSTSPSYLILQSLDRANAYLADCAEVLHPFLEKVRQLKEKLKANGWQLRDQEPLKVTIAAKPLGYRGEELAACLLERGIVCEFADPDYLVLMLTPEVGEEGLKRLEDVLLAIARRASIDDQPPRLHRAERGMSIREAAFSPSQLLPVEQCPGRILAAATVGCPPAVPILVCGERIDEHAIACFRYYGIEQCAVIME